VIVSSRALREDAVGARGSDARVHLIGNGVDFGAFRRALSGAGAGPPATGDVRVGYLGAVGAWFDFDLVADVARSRPEWRVAIVGPVLADGRAGAARLASLPNVAFQPAVAHEDVPRVLAGFTVAIIPFRRTALTAGVNPNKLYEYMAAGVPTVATPFSADLEAGPAVALAAGAGDFTTACESFARARLDPARRSELAARAVDAASAHDWDAIAAAFWRAALPV
jgi:glycosyltransferase involved in cell wall biosynthesis